MNKRPTQEQIDFIRSSDLPLNKIKKLTGIPTSIIKYFKGIKKRSAVKQRSKKMTAGMIEYKKVRAEFLEKNPRCQICGNEQMLSIHHIAGRSGRNLCDPNNFLVTCLGGSYYLSDLHEGSNRRDGCHPWIESNLKLSRELGYSKSKRYESNPDNKL